MKDRTKNEQIKEAEADKLEASVLDFSKIL